MQTRGVYSAYLYLARYGRPTSFLSDREMPTRAAALQAQQAPGAIQRRVKKGTIYVLPYYGKIQKKRGGYLHGYRLPIAQNGGKRQNLASAPYYP